MKAVQLLVNSYLPEELRDYSRTYDTKSLNVLLGDIARKYPDRFAELSKKISDIGRNASYLQGETITLDDLEPVVDKTALFAAMQAEMDKLPKDETYQRRWREISQKYNTLLEKEVAKNALGKRNNIAMAVLSGARGKNAQLKAMIGTPWTFSDYKGEPIDIISKESVAEGMRPVVLGASTYGARASVVSTKKSTAKGGDWAKQMASAAADMVIRKHNCGTHNGIALSTSDRSLKGRVLGREAGGYKAGTMLTSAVVKDLQDKGISSVVARSPLTCQAEGGLCATCVGAHFSGGKLPKVGDSVGLASSSATGEPITQMALNAKHQGGMTSAKREYAGLDVINQFTQSPDKFKDRAAVAELDGRVEDISEAPQGGMFVTVSGEKHYVPAGHDVEVKVGDRVEAGDQLSEGLLDAEDAVRLKGLGAGRKYYADRLNKILDASGTGVDPRLTEVLARAAVRHVRITDDDGYGNWLPDDVVDYNTLQSSYKMPETTALGSPTKMTGKFLQAPALHYTIGTRITPNVAKDLEDNGYNLVYADSEAPKFEPEMIRLRTSSHTNPDWLASLGTSYLSKQLNESSVRGDDTNVLSNSDYRPRIAYGAGFGENAAVTGEF